MVIKVMWVVTCAMFLSAIILVSVHLVGQAGCYKKGYPKAVTTIFLDTYCMNLEGTVTVSVNKLD